MAGNEITLEKGPNLSGVSIVYNLNIYITSIRIGFQDRLPSLQRKWSFPTSEYVGSLEPPSIVVNINFPRAGRVKYGRALLATHLHKATI